MTTPSRNLFCTAAIVASVAGLPVTAQTVETLDVIPLDAWTYDDLYAGGRSVDDFIDEMEVYGVNGEEIGDIENVLFGSDGRVLSIIAEVGGFWDIGDTHVNIPWQDVDIRADGKGVNVPVTEETVDDFSLYPDEMIFEVEADATIEAVDDDAETGPRVWRATELIGDYVRLLDGDGYINYGYVNDIIIHDDAVAAVMVRPGTTWGTPGVYGYPYYGYAYGWEPGLDHYTLPYAQGEIVLVEPFDYTLIVN